MPATIPHTFADGPGITASGVEVMDNFNAVNAGVFMAVVSSLPSSPVNGQDCYYLADATNGVVWHLKYRSASASTFKWEFVGGGSLHAEVATMESRGAITTYADLATVGPSVTVPVAGEYEIAFGARVQTPSVVGQSGNVSVSIGGVTAVVADATWVDSAAAQIANFSTARTIWRTAAATNVVKLQYAVTNTSFQFGNRWLGVRPVRVG